MRKEIEVKARVASLNEVEELGSFVEVEKITDEENAEEVQRELFDLLVSIGVDPKDRIFQGYDTLTYISKNK